MYKKLAVIVAATSTISILISQSSLANVSNTFQLPSKNIHCGLVEVEIPMLRCEIRSGLNPLPPQPKNDTRDCDWGAGLLLPMSGKPRILCITDTIATGTYTLAYGSTWRNAGFKCTSSKTGLTCTNKTGNGFFLSRERWRGF